MRSVEQSQDFQIARRVAALVAPGWRLLATPLLEPGALAVDLRKRAIELGENSTLVDLLAGAMFGLGHARLQKSARFPELFARGLHKYHDEKILISKLATQGALADQYAAQWAARALSAFWPTHDCGAALAAFAWRRTDWTRYFTGT